MSWFWQRARPLRQGTVRRYSQLDPWERLPLAPPLRAFGPGATDFAHFLGGTSRVEARSPHEVAAWLQECRYATDEVLLAEEDCWLHPTTFETVRCGDCEDFSLWGWRQLITLGFEAEFVVGVRRQPDGREGRHAWTVYRDGRDYFLLDGVERSLARAIRPIAEIAYEYEPQVGARASGDVFAFAGLFRAEWARGLPFEKRR